MTKNNYTGINIQWPISRLILFGEKTIETRTYPIPKKYLNEEMLLIETPGKKGKFKARVTAILKFTECYKYLSREDFYMDMDLHKVTPDSTWAWSDEKPKYGWTVQVIKKFAHPIPLSRTKGIVYTKNIHLQQHS